jgi:hypothetical protein
MLPPFLVSRLKKYPGKCCLNYEETYSGLYRGAYLLAKIQILFECIALCHNPVPLQCQSRLLCLESKFGTTYLVAVVHYIAHLENELVKHHVPE